MKNKLKSLIYLSLLTVSLASCNKASASIDAISLSGNISDALISEDPINSTGTDNVMVIPVENSENTYSNEMIDTITKAFNGTCEETGYYSLTNYINVSSYGKLSLNCDILDKISTSSSISEYSNIVSDSINEINNVSDLSKYDVDNDLYIDSIYFIYSSELTNTYSYSQRLANNFTKFVDVSISGTNYKIGNVSFVDYATITKNYAGNYNTDNLLIDSHEIIHQFGYVLGLDDMNDYDTSYPTYSIGYEKPWGDLSSTMMSGVVGDFSSFEKILLGWATVYEASGSYTVSKGINSFETSGEVIIWSDHTVTSMFDEYFIFEILSNELLNSDGAVSGTSSSSSFKVLKVTHIEAELSTSGSGEPVKMDEEYNKTAFLYDNVDSVYYRSNIIIKSSYTSEATLTCDYFFKTSDIVSGTYKFYRKNTTKSITYALVGVSDEGVATISFTL